MEVRGSDAFLHCRTGSQSLEGGAICQSIFWAGRKDPDLSGKLPSTLRQRRTEKRKLEYEADVPKRGEKKSPDAVRSKKWKELILQKCTFWLQVPNREEVDES